MHEKQFELYPSTRYMGSKFKLIEEIRRVIRSIDCDSVADLFSGSGVVSYMLKTEGKRVVSNDYMALCAAWSKALVENNHVRLTKSEARQLTRPQKKLDTFVQQNFKDLYFTDQENKFIDTVRSNFCSLPEYKKEIAITALTRACYKKRPRGIFTYTGFRYDDGRKDLKKTLEEHFFEAVDAVNAAVFDNNRSNVSLRGDAQDVTDCVDVVYIDPPYYSTRSDNEYVRRYHFIEGIACGWEGVDMQWNTKTKKFKNYPTPFSNKATTHEAFNKLFAQHQNSAIVVSYSSNSLPTKEEMVKLLGQYKEDVEVISLDYRYHAGNHGHKVHDNKSLAQEYIFVGR